MFPWGQRALPQSQQRGGCHLPSEEVDLLRGQRCAVEVKPGDGIIWGAAEDGFDEVIAGLGDGQGEGEAVSGFGSLPPELFSSGPAAFAELGHFLDGDRPAGGLDDFESFPLEGTGHAHDVIDGPFAGQGHLAGAGQISDQITDLFLGQGGQQSHWHHGDARAQRLGDVVFGDDFFGGHGLDSEGRGGSFADHTGHAATIPESEDIQFIIGTDEGVGMNDIFEDVVEVSAIRAGQFWPDVSALAEKRMALAAGRGVEHATGAAIGPFEKIRSQHAFPSGHFRSGHAGKVTGGSDLTPGGFQTGGQRRVFEIGDLPGHETRDFGAGDGTTGHGVEQRGRPHGAGGEGVDGGRFFFGRKPGVERDHGGGGGIVTVGFF